MTPLLEIEGLHVAVDGTEILRGVDLAVGEGELHALMGPNGSGKSTLASTLLGNPVVPGHLGRHPLPGRGRHGVAHRRAGQGGMFLAFQYPEEIPGVPVIQFLRQAVSGRVGDDRSVLEVRMSMLEWMKRLGMDPAFGERHLNEGFSGGEKKRNEILQMAMLDPELAVLDETDSGLDIDALRIVADGVQAVRGERPSLGVLLVTHYTRILELLRPDAVHVLVDGRIVESGGPKLWPSASRPKATSRGGGDGDELSRRPQDVRRRCAPIRARSDVDFSKLKGDFPVLGRTVHGHRVVYLDSASSAQRPQCVLDAMDAYYQTTHANVHRGVYTIAEEADRLYEAARVAVGRLIGAPDPEHEVIFTKNATESINLVAATWARVESRARVTWCCSPTWSTTPTSCRG